MYFSEWYTMNRKLLNNSLRNQSSRNDALRMFVLQTDGSDPHEDVSRQTARPSNKKMCMINYNRSSSITGLSRIFFNRNQQPGGYDSNQLPQTGN